VPARRRFHARQIVRRLSGRSIAPSGRRTGFITVGEALLQADKRNPGVLQPISSLRQITGFRNVLVHGYSAIQDATVWGVIENDVPSRKQQVTDLLAQSNPP
jgi:uncharacterized protein with HEPN domain